jgi:hypothetical protein
MNPPSSLLTPLVQIWRPSLAEDLCRTWAADRTTMLRMTSKRVKISAAVRPPAVVRWSMSFLQDKLNGTDSMGQPVRSYSSLSGSLLF